MLDARLQNSIRSSIRSALQSARGLADISEFRNHFLALLVLKYLSDRQRDRVVPAGASVEERDGAYQGLLDAARTGDVGSRIDGVLADVERSHPELHGVFRDIRFGSATLGNADQRKAVLTLLLNCFDSEAFDFKGDAERALQAAAFASQCLIHDIAAICGRRGFDFFTPPAVSDLIARITQPKPGERICDPCCGSGSLLLACDAAARSSHEAMGCRLYGQEKSGSTWAMAKMNMVLNGHQPFNLELGDTLLAPRLVTEGRLETFDVVVASIPFGVSAWGHERASEDPFGRYLRGVPPRSTAEYAFISHMVATMKAGHGRMAAVVPLGVLFRKGAEEVIRTKLLHEGLVDAVIALPPKLYPYTNLPVALLVLRHGRRDERVLFIDASQGFEHGKTQNVLRETDIARIEAAYQAREDIANFARTMPLEEVVGPQNKGDLSVTRYVSTPQELERVDLAALRAERQALKVELADLEARFEALTSAGAENRG